MSKLTLTKDNAISPIFFPTQLCPHFKSRVAIAVSRILEEIFDKIDLKVNYLVQVISRPFLKWFYLDKCANDNHYNLCQGPVLHVAEICLDDVKVPGLGTLGHLLKLSDDLKND